MITLAFIVWENNVIRRSQGKARRTMPAWAGRPSSAAPDPAPAHQLHGTGALFLSPVCLWERDTPFRLQFPYL